MIKLLAYTEKEAYYQTDKGTCVYLCPEHNINEPVRGSAVSHALKDGFTKSDKEFAKYSELEQYLIELFKEPS